MYKTKLPLNKEEMIILKKRQNLTAKYTAPSPRHNGHSEPPTAATAAATANITTTTAGHWLEHYSPKFIIGGAMKCGTNEAMTLVQQHPRVTFKTCFLHNNSNCNAADYQGVQDENSGNIFIWECSPKDLLAGRISSQSFLERFARTDGSANITVDKSPAFLDTFQRRNLPSVIRKLLPGTKMVFTLCDPAERLVSEYYHNHRWPSIQQKFDNKFQQNGLQPPANVQDFLQIITLTHSQCHHQAKLFKACTAIKNIYFQKGLYHEGILDWLKVYDNEMANILILDMNANVTMNTRQMLEFAGLPVDEYPWEHLQDDGTTTKIAFKNTGYKGRTAAWDEYPKEMTLLSSLYSDSNKELASLIQQEFPLKWKSSTTARN